MSARAVFQSTLPAREATQIKVQEAEAEQISIHASREGSDNNFTLSHNDYEWISIHASREGSD